MLKRITASVRPPPAGLWISCGLIFNPRFFRTEAIDAIRSGGNIPSSTRAKAKETDEIVTAKVTMSAKRALCFRFIYQWIPLVFFEYGQTESITNSFSPGYYVRKASRCFDSLR